MRRIVFGLVLAVQSITALTAGSLRARFSELPDFYFDKASFESRSYLAIAIELQALGRETAIERLREFAQQRNGMNAILLCRMLFVARPGQSFRPPMLGVPNTLRREDRTQWPLEPVAVLDGVPFLITDGYWIAGLPESGVGYLDYCATSCDWNPVRYRDRTNEDFEKAFLSLSRVVTVLLFEADFTKSFLRKQIEAVREDHSTRADERHVKESEGAQR